MFRIGKYVGTHRARHFFTEIMKQRFDIHVVFRNKRAKQGLRGGIQLKTMKSCDLLVLAFLKILTVYYDNLSLYKPIRNFVLVDVLRFLIPRNATKPPPVSLTGVQKPLKAILGRRSRQRVHAERRFINTI